MEPCTCLLAEPLCGFLIATCFRISSFAQFRLVQLRALDRPILRFCRRHSALLRRAFHGANLVATTVLTASKLYQIMVGCQQLRSTGYGPSAPCPEL